MSETTTTALKYDVRHDATHAVVEWNGSDLWRAGVSDPIRRTFLGRDFQTEAEARAWAEQMVEAVARARRLYESVREECVAIIDHAYGGEAT